MWRLAARRGWQARAPAARSGLIARGHAAAAASTPVQAAATSVPAVLAAVSAASPFKDAAKFYGSSSDLLAAAAPSDGAAAPPRGVSLWTYRDLNKHVCALAAGLADAGFAEGHKIAVYLPPGSQEYVTLLLAAANAGVTIVSIEPPANPAAVDVAPIRAALNKYQPQALVLWHGYKTADAGDSTSTSESHSILAALAPSAATDDSRGRSGFSRVTGRPIVAPDFPALTCVVHTGDEHVRGAIAFKSLLNYGTSERAPSSSASSVVLVEAASGKALTHGELLRLARENGAKLGLVSDPYGKTGKLVLRPASCSATVTSVVSALMHESLFILPGLSSDANRCKSVAEAENAVVA
jgi:AMP-binding enzyme